MAKEQEEMMKVEGTDGPIERPKASLENTQIFVTDAARSAFFANNVRVKHSREEFFFEFFLSDDVSITLGARVVITPAHFKRLYKSMSDMLERYEKKNGVIQDGSRQGD